jgi:two-component system, OmpR family, KDP operon response regulator KdpE
VIVVVEDQRAQQLVLRTALEARGYDVEFASDGNEAMQLIRVVDPDLIVLDLGLPDIDGLDLCRHLRVLVRCPIIVVTADAEEHRIIDALDLGADDYIIKPYSMTVLLARIRVALRHHAAAAAIVSDRVLVAGDVSIDIAAHQLKIGGEPVEMQARQFALLVLLVRNADRVLTYSAIARALGDIEPEPANRNSWRVLISKIRKQLGSGPERPVIESELNVGYRLQLPVGRDRSGDSGIDSRTDAATSSERRIT